MQHYSICFWCDSNLAIDPCQSWLHDKRAHYTYNRTEVTSRSLHFCLKGGASCCTLCWVGIVHLYGLNHWRHNADVCKIKPWLTVLCSILLRILLTHFSAISPLLLPCVHISSSTAPSSLISSSPKHRLQILELFTPFLLFSLLQLVLSSPGYFPYLCVINIKKRERLPFPPAPHCESACQRLCLPGCHIITDVKL